MELSFDVFAVSILLAPFIAALLAPLVSRGTGPAAGWILAIAPAALFACLFSFIGDVAAGVPQRIAIDWVPALGLSLGFYIDGLSLTFGLLITGIGALIIVYASAYLSSHPQRGRFLAFMLAFMGAMLGLVLADGFVSLFVFWELTSVTSFLLIGFDTARVEARRAALQALVVTGIGGMALLAAGVLLHSASGTWDYAGAFALGGALRVSAIYPWLLGLIALAAFTKSAQWPFHFWLPNAMEAPTPVSAYLHSATMVQAGVYLLARMSPVLGGTPQWMLLLSVVGGVTLLWGALVALSQTDLKQMLAQTTIASLGLLVLLLGIGGETAAIAVAAYFVAHALYKAALFLVVGIIDKGTGTRDITALGGLRDSLTISFIAGGLAAISMFGLPPFLGWFAKEEMYASTGLDGWVLLAVMVAGNALLSVVALAIAIRPFMGTLKPTPSGPKEGPFAMWLGPSLMGLAGLAVVFVVGTYGDLVLAPMAGAIVGEAVENHLYLHFDPLGLPLWLSVVTWAVAGLVYWRLDTVREVLAGLLRRVRWSFDKGFDQVMFALVQLAGAMTRVLHHGRLELYVGILFVALALALFVPLSVAGSWPAIAAPELLPHEWAVLALGVVGVVTVVLARSRLLAVLALGVQGLAVGLLFILFGAPDLGFTQLMVEAISVVIVALVMTRLHLDAKDPRPLEDLWRDGALALICGLGVAGLLLKVLAVPFDARLSEFFAANSYALAHGRNVVNVILVDFRGLDTLGEISVVMAAGIAVLTLIRRQKRDAPGARRGARKGAAA